MSNLKFSIAALLLPLTAIAMPAEAAKDTRAARAECFRQANEAAANQGAGANVGDRNAMGTDAYRSCCRKAGIRP